MTLSELRPPPAAAGGPADPAPAGLMRHAPDAAAAEAAAAAFLEALGWDLDHEHTRGTPGRMARAYAEMLTPEPFTMTAFGSDGGGLVTVRGIGFTSVCAHHALPFAGTAEVTYAPGGQVAGLSKIARIVQAAARGPQVQELMTGQVADALMDAISPRGVTVRLEAAHLCLTARGARAAGTSMITSAARGTLAAGGCCQAPAGGLSAGGPLLPEGH